ncbi:MAG TPA: hypothetical protein VH637_05850 [Streptosporangiaceae bacterium]
MPASKPQPLLAYLEVTKRRTFAMALDWPGWGRAGKTPEAALAALADYATRYAAAAEKAGVPFAADVAGQIRVTEEVAGNATTEFGAPAVFASGDADPWGGEEAARAAALLRGAWAVLDGTAASAPAELRKGPRGGGRDRDKMVDHVLAAECSYARKIGVKVRQPALTDAAAIADMRQQILAVVERPAPDGLVVARGWPVRYAVRRIAWHALDHAWEMEDRSDRTGT